ncbi:MAG: peroxiredoxin-like family protein [Verrucomicrobiae bacterium]|nr:peroxiredoxin-like family protein [Verrucomicrobiae bacterium]
MTREQLLERSRQRPILLVFLRHLGCTFCRETLADISRRRRDIAKLGADIVLVHMADPQQWEGFIRRYGLQDVTAIHDPGKELYRAFGLGRGTLRQLFGLRVWLRGIAAGIFRGHGLSIPRQDPWQMPGVFVLKDGKITAAYRHRYVSDRPHYVGLVCEGCGLPGTNALNPASENPLPGTRARVAPS